MTSPSTSRCFRMSCAVVCVAMSAALPAQAQQMSSDIFDADAYWTPYWDWYDTEYVPTYRLRMFAPLPGAIAPGELKTLRGQPGDVTVVPTPPAVPRPVVPPPRTLPTADDEQTPRSVADRDDVEREPTTEPVGEAEAEIWY